jgi:hypothetical protein
MKSGNPPNLALLAQPPPLVIIGVKTKVDFIDSVLVNYVRDRVQHQQRANMILLKPLIEGEFCPGRQSAVDDPDLHRDGFSIDVQHAEAQDAFRCGSPKEAGVEVGKGLGLAPTRGVDPLERLYRFVYSFGTGDDPKGDAMRFFQLSKPASQIGAHTLGAFIKISLERYAGNGFIREVTIFIGPNAKPLSAQCLDEAGK